MSTDRSLRVSEIFESIQGEGASAGAPSVFLRLGVCNLRCRWCDTKYTWDWAQYRYEEEVRELSIAAVVEQLDGIAEGHHLVITGGEPMLQQPALIALLAGLTVARHVEIETNGTLSPRPELARRVDQWNVSPKLENSGEDAARRTSLGALTALRDTGRAWLKLVLEGDADRAEAEGLIRRLEWPKDRVLFMPQASSREALAERAPLVERWAREAGVGVSPRLHVERWDGQRGV
jgi:organic radical activating enzyme